jgi:hypothetical protein
VPKIVLHERARLDVEEQAAFFAKDSVELARAFLTDSTAPSGACSAFPAWAARGRLEAQACLACGG